MRNAGLDEAQAGIKISGRNINNLRYADDTTLMADCSHESNRRLLLGRKAMTNPDSILKSRDVILPTKVCLVKVIVFPVVMYECECWTIKKAERQELMLWNCGVGEDS